MCSPGQSKLRDVVRARGLDRSRAPGQPEDHDDHEVRRVGRGPHRGVRPVAFQRRRGAAAVGSASLGRRRPVAPALGRVFARPARRRYVSRAARPAAAARTARDRQQRGDDVGERDDEVVGDEELGDGEGESADQRGRPGLPHPARPSTMNTSTSGTNTRAAGSAARPSRPGRRCGRPVTVASVVIGTASAPNATGAVLATSATVAALIGLKPSAISMTLVIATGVPNRPAPPAARRSRTR